MLRRIGLLLFAGGLLCSFADPADERLFKEKIAKRSASTSAQRITQLALSFLGTPYVAHTLEQGSTEHLVINLRQLDCTTFVENVLALSRTTNDFSDFQSRIQQLRYRNGVINGYGSRLHYLSSVLMQAQQLSVLEDITAQIGGEHYNKTIDFMSKHRQLYPALRDSLNFEEIKKSESLLALQNRFYIPKANIFTLESKINDGDLIGITSSVAGLDVSHEGFALRKDNRIYLIHASSQLGKVVVSDEPLMEYLASHKEQTGIIVARIK
ncbi:MAG: DUF1460 domain-containing protein [Siphonobacter sp.]